MNDDSDRRSRIVRVRASKRRARLALTGMLLVFVGLAVILAIASFRSDAGIRPYATVLAGLGWAVAAYHGLLYAGVIPAGIEPCGAGPSCSGGGMTVLGTIPIPYLSIAAFTAILLLLLPSRRSSR